MTQPFRALIIDDDPDLLALLRRTLEFTAGWQVFTAVSGPDGLALAARLTPPPHVILVDFMMPAMDGYEVCRALKARPETAALPVVVLTARREVDDERWRAAGAAGVLFKPFRAESLAQEIRALCP
jgi:CheY-like chemotaxis protein